MSKGGKIWINMLIWLIIDLHNSLRILYKLAMVKENLAIKWVGFELIGGNPSNPNK